MSYPPRRQHLPHFVTAELRVVVKSVGRPLDFFFVLGHGLALLAGQQLDEGGLMVPHAGRHLVKKRGPVVGGKRGPRGKSAGGRGHGGFDFSAPAFGHSLQHGPAGRIADFTRFL